jgi:uncharacterized membrane protein
LNETLPFVAFLVVYAIVVMALEQFRILQFTHRWAFCLMVTSLWVWWVWHTGLSGLSRRRRVLVLLARLALVGLFVMMLAEPRSVRTNDTLTVVFAVDTSDSVGDGAVDQAMDFVARVGSDKPDEDRAGLIFFGRNAAVELPPRQSFPFERNRNVQIAPDATDLERSLTLAAAMVPEETAGRIVLISDGAQTTGSLDSVLNQLASRGISVDVLPLEYHYDREMWVERLELPRFVKLGENYHASVLLSSLQADEARLILRETAGGDRKIVWEQPVQLAAGKTRVDVPILVGAPGFYEYEATLEPRDGSDHLAQNNSVLNYLYVEGQGKVLVVVDPSGEPTDWQPLSQAIREGDRDLEVLDAYEVPRDPLSLLPYDCIVFVNVGQDAFDMVQLQAVHDAVYNQGIGFLMVGGPNSFGPGGYHRTVIEELLPVSMDITQKKILPKGALVIILHTCEFADGNTWGKRIAKQAIRVLSAQDEVGVLASLGSGSDWAFELTPAGEYDRLVTMINGLGIGDMPAFGPSMRQGLDALKQSDAAAKHMIIISDGDPVPPPPTLIRDFIDTKVSCSTVAIFPHGGSDISTLRSIADVTGGRYYFPDDANQLPSIFIKEAKTLKRSMVQQKTIQPEVGFPSQILDGIEALPPLHGYVLTTAKPMSESVLVTLDEEGDTQELNPVLSVWRYGLASTAAFTSDLSTAWGRDWVDWEKYRAFVKQLLIRISRVREPSDLRLWTTTQGGEATIVVEDFHEQESFLELQAHVRGPREQEQVVPLKQIAPRRYQASFPVWGTGRYQVLAVGDDADRQERVHGGFIVSYSPEYLRFRSDPFLLKQILNRTGGTLLTGAATAEEIFGRRREQQSTQPIFDWFLVALACLWPLDVGLRRIQWDWQVVRGWLGLGRGQQSTATMGQLLRRKQEVGQALGTAVGRTMPPSEAVFRPRPIRKPPSPARRSPPPHGASPASAPPDVPPASTTARLLDQKRRRQQSDFTPPDDTD